MLVLGFLSYTQFTVISYKIFIKGRGQKIYRNVLYSYDGSDASRDDNTNIISLTALNEIVVNCQNRSETNNLIHYSVSDLVLFLFVEVFGRRHAEAVLPSKFIRVANFENSPTEIRGKAARSFRPSINST